jgi:hypothetical protein
MEKTEQRRKELKKIEKSEETFEVKEKMTDFTLKKKLETYKKHIAEGFQGSLPRRYTMQKWGQISAKKILLR